MRATSEPRRPGDPPPTTSIEATTGSLGEEDPEAVTRKYGLEAGLWKVGFAG